VGGQLLDEENFHDTVEETGERRRPRHNRRRASDV
jgi:hypothetical protein